MYPWWTHRLNKENDRRRTVLLVLLWFCRSLRTWLWAWLPWHWLIARLLISKLMTIFKSRLRERMLRWHHRLAFEHRARAMELCRSLSLGWSLCLWCHAHRLRMHMSMAAVHCHRNKDAHLNNQKNQNYYTDCKNYIQEFVVFHNLPLSIQFTHI